MIHKSVDCYHLTDDRDQCLPVASNVIRTSSVSINVEEFQRLVKRFLRT